MPGAGAGDGGDAGPPLTKAARELLDGDVRASTKEQYSSKLRVFSAYCAGVGANPSTCHVNTVINFLTMLVREKGLGYNTVCGYRSAIGRQHKGVAGVPLGQHPSIKRLVRACFIQKPPLPRYADIWDVDQVLRHLEGMPPVSELSMMDLSIKTASLTFILTLSRCRVTLG